MGTRTTDRDPNDTRAGICAVVCTICGRPRAACEPSWARLRLCQNCARKAVPDLAECSRCAVEVLPNIIAQAVMAAAEECREIEEGMAAGAAVRRNFYFAAVEHAALYNGHFGMPNMPDFLHEWDDEEDEMDDYPLDDEEYGAWVTRPQPRPRAAGRHAPVTAGGGLPLG